MTALSHLLFFDALSAILCTTVDVGRNFEVWTRSSLRNPFGLERSELVAGLAMSIVLLFMGLDLISHGLTHGLENAGGHVPHHAHSHERISPGSIDTAALAAILSTLVSAASLGNHSRIGRAIHPSKLPGWIPAVLRNPSHLLTLSCSTLLLLLPWLSTQVYAWFDNALAFTIAFAMIVLGGRLCYSLGCVLLMSFPGRDSDDIKDLVADLWDDDAISGVEEAKIWQVHYGLCMANFKIKVRQQDAIQRVREKISSLVKSRLAGDAANGRGVKWEISSMISVDRD
jgi:divalent metal cation (Fe/Co/Zn/Cd) transporter